jgi:hypothetical protein
MHADVDRLAALNPLDPDHDDPPALLPVQRVAVGGNLCAISVAAWRAPLFAVLAEA